MSGEGRIWVGYTTRYREGGAENERAARTMARELADRHGAWRVELERVESKREFVDAVRRTEAWGGLAQLHLLGHSGMYGPMFRTTAMPEQLSPHEWRTLRLPFVAGGEAFFHACRTARWFAPFFARTQGVPASGYHWYTTFSARPDRFAWEPPWRASRDRPLWLFGCEGRKSHGWEGSVRKYLGAPPEPLKRFLPEPPAGDPSYDRVAERYARTFRDIRVRVDEWRWLREHLPPGPLRVLDIGCGNGALLRQLAPDLQEGLGVDASSAMVAIARRDTPDPHLRFEHVDGPVLPAADGSVDVVISLLSFRYLDWDPLMNEIRRVLAPGGRLLVVDMVTAPPTARELPRLAVDVARGRVRRWRNPAFDRELRELVGDPAWDAMLAHNPIRAQHELVWYLESRFPGRRVELLNVGRTARVLAFDSGPLQPGSTAPQSYP
ncbi:MAG: class I SAM-dependent methyltransferase [Myxococcales bacterium]|nr:class I SAM-dependent methyltransferase [Myxococcales bacterium]